MKSKIFCAWEITKKIQNTHRHFILYKLYLHKLWQVSYVHFLKAYCNHWEVNVVCVTQTIDGCMHLYEIRQITILTVGIFKSTTTFHSTDSTQSSVGLKGP